MANKKQPEKKQAQSKAVQAKRQQAAARAAKPRGLKAAAVVHAKTSKGRRQTEFSGIEEMLSLTVCNWVCGWDFEIEARAEGAALIAGVDEVGRGPLFGPVVAAAVILPHGVEHAKSLAGLNDSKQLTEEERERFNAIVREVAICWAVAEVDVRTIDRINILQASRLAMKLAVAELEARGHRPDCLLIDGNQKIDYCPPGAVCRQKTIVQGDARSFSIAAASVIAKVHRDRLLRELDEVYPGYGLATNKGYATAEHRAALQRLGITELHRRSFAPVAALFEIEVEGEGIEMEFGFIEE